MLSCFKDVYDKRFFIKLNVLGLKLLHRLLSKSSKHCLYLKLPCAYLSCTPRVFILEQYMIYVCCSAFKQTALTVIISKFLGEYTLLHLSSNFLSSFLYACILAFHAPNSAMHFPPSSFFIISKTFVMSFLLVTAYFRLLNIQLFQTLSLRLLQCLFKNLLSLSQA